MPGSAGHRNYPGKARMAQFVRDEPGCGEWYCTTSDEGSEQLINNRQNGRRRGRGGARPQNGASGPDRGNRLDNRARGNANQLHEKYKTLARDAQMQGDRVMTEYYLQFADHYFRILSENRSRFEDQQPRRERFDAQDYDDEDGEGEALAGEDRFDGDNGRGHQPRQAERGQEGPRGHEGSRGNEGGYEPRRDREPRQDREPREFRQEREPRQDREARQPREPRQERAPRPPRDEQPLFEGLDEGAAEAPAAEAPAAEAAPAETRRPRGRPRRAAAPEAAPERIEIDRLPPSLAVEPAPAPANGAANGGNANEAEAEKPRRRTRRPRTDAPVAEA